jgi:hypothetical protein
MTDPPLVTTSSTTATGLSAQPSIHLRVPWSLRSLRTLNMLRTGPSLSEQ